MLAFTSQRNLKPVRHKLISWTSVLSKFCVCERKTNFLLKEFLFSWLNSLKPFYTLYAFQNVHKRNFATTIRLRWTSEHKPQRTYPNFPPFPVSFKDGPISIGQHIPSHPLMSISSALCYNSCNTCNITEAYLKPLSSIINTCAPRADRVDSSQPWRQVVIVVCRGTKGSVYDSFILQAKWKSTASWEVGELTDQLCLMLMWEETTPRKTM